MREYTRGEEKPKKKDPNETKSKDTQGAQSEKPKWKPKKIKMQKGNKEIKIRKCANQKASKSMKKQNKAGKDCKTSKKMKQH